MRKNWATEEIPCSEEQAVSSELLLQHPFIFATGGITAPLHPSCLLPPECPLEVLLIHQHTEEPDLQILPQGFRFNFMPSVSCIIRYSFSLPLGKRLAGNLLDAHTPARKSELFCNPALLSWVRNCHCATPCTCPTLQLRRFNQLLAEAGLTLFLLTRGRTSREGAVTACPLRGAEPLQAFVLHSGHLSHVLGVSARKH